VQANVKEDQRFHLLSALRELSCHLVGENAAVGKASQAVGTLGLLLTDARDVFCGHLFDRRDLSRLASREPLDPLALLAEIDAESRLLWTERTREGVVEVDARDAEDSSLILFAMPQLGHAFDSSGTCGIR